jgi:hypothetical protein
MEYNCTISNTDALPIPYAIVTGKDDVIVNSLYKDKPQFLWCDYITGSGNGDMKFVGRLGETHIRLIIAPVPALNVKFESPKKP